VALVRRWKSEQSFVRNRLMLQSLKELHTRDGSWTINDQGGLSLMNRPLTAIMQIMEDEDIPVDIPRDLSNCSHSLDSLE
jgi:hypothetical protein